MKKALSVLIGLGIVAASVGAYYHYRKSRVEPTVTTAAVTRGDIVDTVGATGTLQAVTTVQVGTQVSGTIQELHADFNSLVRQGQVLARLDPSLFETQIEQARANLIRAQADVERQRVALDDAMTKLARAEELADKKLIPRTDLESAQVAVRSAQAQLRSAQAQVTQAQASLNQNEVNLQHTVIQAPIDGLVISRNVDVGQTVAASMQAPTLFVLAADLTKMQVVANLDESDVGRIRPGQPVMFRVDAYPAEDFVGSVSQVRLQPIVQQNVVTYATVIDVPNPELKLKPGMTANVNVAIARRSNAVRIPNAALRFRPTNEIFAALGQTPPGAPNAGDASGTRTPGAPAGVTHVEGGASRPAPNAGPSQTPPSRPSRRPDNSPNPRAAARQGQVPGGEAGRSLGEPGENPGDAFQSGFGRRGDGGERGGFGRGDNAGRGRFAERFQNMSPEDRAQMLERMRARGVDPSARGIPEANTPRESPQAKTPAGDSPQSLTARNPRATTIDALFGPLPPVESVGRVWLYVNKQLKPVRVRLGISDGQASELLEGDIQPGTELVTNVSTGEATRPAVGGLGGFPFLGQPRGFGGGLPGGAGGGGRQGGGRQGGGR